MFSKRWQRCDWLAAERIWYWLGQPTLQRLSNHQSGRHAHDGTVPWTLVPSCRTVMTQRLVSHTTATESLLFQPLCWKRWPLCHGVGGCWAQAQRGLQDHTRRGSSRPTQRQCLSRKTRCMGWPEANVSPTPMHLSLANRRLNRPSVESVLRQFLPNDSHG